MRLIFRTSDIFLGSTDLSWLSLVGLFFWFRCVLLWSGGVLLWSGGVLLWSLRCWLDLCLFARFGCEVILFSFVAADANVVG